MSTTPSIETLSKQIDQADKAREQGKYDEAQDTLNLIVGECEQRLDDPTAKSLYARACQVYATCFSDQEILGSAEKWASRAQAATEGIGGKEEGTSKILLADIHRKQGMLRMSVDEFQAGIKMLDVRSIERADALGGMAHAEMALGRPHYAITHREQALAIAEDLGNAVAVGIFKGDLAKDNFCDGRLSKAEKIVREALSGVDPAHPRCGSYSHKVLGDILLAQEKVEPAREAYKLAAKTDNPHCAAMALTGLGWLELRTGSFNDAKAYFEQASAIVHDDQALKTEGLAGKAVAQWGCGERSDAEDTIVAATRKISAEFNLYTKGHVKAAEAALLRAQRRRGAPQAMEASNEAFSQTAIPLIGLGEKLFAAIKEKAAPEKRAR